MRRPGRIGPYEVLGTLGEGGMGAVYRVRHPTLEAERALKLLLRPTPQQLSRFQREVLRLAQVRHPNVVSIHDSGVAGDGRPYFVMDLLDGRPLDEALADDGPPGLEQALEWAVGICAGVQALHEQGIVHRDLKPQNVLLTRDRRPVVLDVGLAVDPERDERLTKTGALVGTVSYMAPEQFAGEVSARTDVYALGLIVHELVTGVSAAPMGSGPEAVAEILGQDRPLPGSTDSSLPYALDRVVARATARDPSQRYPDAAALGQALRSVLDRPGASRRLVRGLWGVAVLTLLGALIAGGVASLRGRSPGAATARDDGSGAKEGALDLTWLRRLPPGEERARAAADWLAEHPDDAGRALVEALRAEAHQQWGREQVKVLRGLKRPDALYVAVRDWQETFGPKHPNAGVVQNLLKEAARRGPIKTCELAGFATFRSAESVLSAARTGVHFWDLRRLARDGVAKWSSGRTLFRPSSPTRGLFVTGPRDRVLLSWYDLGQQEERKFVRPPFVTRRIELGPRGETVALIGFDRLEVRSFPEGAVRYTHHAPAEIKDAIPDGQGRLGIVYWGMLGDARRPPPVLDVRRMSDDRLLKRHLLVGSGLHLALAPDGRTIAVGTGLGRVYVFDLQDPARKTVFVGRELSDSRGGMTDARALSGFATGVAFSPDGRTLFAVASSHDHQTGELRAWEVASGKQVFRVRRPHAPSTVAVSPDGCWLAVSYERDPFELWLWRP